MRDGAQKRRREVTLALTLFAATVSGFCPSVSRLDGLSSVSHSFQAVSVAKFSGPRTAEGFKLARLPRCQAGIVMGSSSGLATSPAVRTVLVAGATGRVGAMVCEEVVDLLPDVFLARLVQHPAFSVRAS